MRRNQKAAAAAALGLAAVVGAGSAQASARCDTVQARIVDAQSTVGCTSAFGFCAAGTARGDIEGTTFYTMDGAVAAPATAPGYAAVSGILVYTTEHGTLSVRETGIGNAPANASRGHIASVEDVLGGTGRFSGVTGTLFITGAGVNGQFVSDVTGRLCRS